MTESKALEAEADALSKAADVLGGAILQTCRDEGIPPTRMISALACASAVLVAAAATDAGLNLASASIHFLNSYRSAATDIGLADKT